MSIQAKITGMGTGTGIFCTSSEFRELKEIIAEVAKTDVMQITGHTNTYHKIPKLPTTQADVFSFVRKLAEKHDLPNGFYGINKRREFIKIVGKEDDFHNVYSYK